jgi:hypothetical protein
LEALSRKGEKTMNTEIDIRKFKRHLQYQHVARRSPLELREVLQAWKTTRGLLFIALVVLVVIIVMAASGRAAENESASQPDAPSALYVERQAPAAPQQESSRLARAIESKAAYRSSQWFLIGATALDAVETYRGLTHPTHLTASYYIPETGLWIYPNVDMTRRFSEGGWAKFAGPRNAGGVVAANVALNAAVLLVSHELAKKGPRWRAVGTMLNSAKATGSVVAASSWSNDFAYADNLPGRWGYPVQTLQWKP